jgi:4-hydroxy-tetrahydrodipicolinate synthase
MTAYPKFHGIIPAIPTAFRNGSCDLDSMRKLLEFLKKSRVHGVVVCGSTGEGATVSDSEFASLMKLARQVLDDSMPIIAGSGTNSTASTIERCNMAKELGADGLLVVTPYYNKPPQEGLYQHFKAVAESTTLPIILYNVPGRTACNLLPETVERLAVIKNIVAIKEASASISQCMEIYARCVLDKRSKEAKEFALLSGEDLHFLPMLSFGCTGVITVLGNVVPRQMVELYDAWCGGDTKTAMKLNYQIRELCELLFVETNPIPLKAALKQMGIFASSEARPPLCEMSSKNLEKLKGTLDKTIESKK